mgnify:CR=1 FL=1
MARMNARTNKKYTQDFKLKVVKAIKKRYLTYLEAVLIYFPQFNKKGCNTQLIGSNGNLTNNNQCSGNSNNMLKSFCNHNPYRYIPLVKRWEDIYIKDGKKGLMDKRMKGSNKSSTKNGNNDTNGLSQTIISKLILDLGNNDIPDTAKLVRSDEVDRLSKLSKEEILEEYLKIFDSQQDLCIRYKYLKKIRELKSGGVNKDN